MALQEMDQDDAARSFPSFRRFTVLVVDDHWSTQIAFSAGIQHPKADVVLATTTITAFEQVTSRPIDLLVISASMVGDGGEPFYRVLWRLDADLKRRSVLIVAPEAIPTSAPRSSPPRTLERPVLRDGLIRLIDAHR
jgi:response regulator RpfG family c-di-GMP phosphodiesterase